jgi:hypothetical protein
MNQTGLSSSDTPGEESAESPHDGAAPTSPARDSAHPPRAAPDMTDAPDEENEKDAQDHLTPAAMVHAASGIQLQRVVRNANDLEKGDDDPEKDVEQVDKVLASVPPTLERQPAVPSQPGAFRAGGARNDDESVLSGTSSVPPTAPGLIEATLVEEGAPPPPPAVVAPIYKGQIVEEADDDTTTAELPENVVTLPKRYVRCFIGAFIILCVITIVSVVVALVIVKDESSSSDKGKNVTIDELPEKKPFWYQEEPPAALWEKLETYPYVSHHMAIVSIINPNISASIIDPQGTYGEAMCSLALDADIGTTGSNNNPSQPSARRFLRDPHSSFGRSRESGISGPTVGISFSCGNAAVTTMNNGVPDTMILFHDADVNASGLGSEFISCKDGRHPDDGANRYNEVFCRIPSGRSGSFPFLFSCFSQTEAMAAEALVETHSLSVQCSVTQNNSFAASEEGDDIEGKLPELLVDLITPAAVVLSTQRFCRVPDGDGFVLQDSLLDKRNLTDACSEDNMRLDVADVPLCLSETMQDNTSYPLEKLSICPNGAEVCFGTNFTLPNVTVYDPWNGGSEDAEACTFSDSVDDSLVQKNANKTVYPGVPLINSSTLQQMQIYLDAQKGWVQDEVLNSSNT